MPQLKCERCGETAEPVLYWHASSNGEVQLGAKCAGCERWIKWVPLRAMWLKHAPPKPEQLRMFA